MIDGILTLEQLGERWIGYVNGRTDAIISMEHPAEPFKVKDTRAVNTPLTQDELEWLRRKVRGSTSGRIGYSLSAGEVEQRIRGVGRPVVEFSITYTPEPEHPVKVFN